MKFIKLSIAVFTLLICCVGCNKENKIVGPATSTTGSLLIWTDNPGKFGSCGPTLLVTLSSGAQSTISNYYSSTPSNCVDQFGGTFQLTAGTYTYTVTSLGSCTYTGSATVLAGKCNLSKIP